MKFDYSKIEPEVFPNFKGGEKNLSAKMFFDGTNRILHGSLEVGATIGMHVHETSSEIIYILSGDGKVLIDDGIEYLKAGDCHYCPKGHSHSLQNNSQSELLVFFAVVPEYK